jgi:ubiquinone/menaquinone biosynthesis C-methylase UbiE
MQQPGFRTKGKVITRLERICEFVENLIFLGRLEQVWQRLIDKAELSLGERVVDVGCGTGKVPGIITSVFGKVEEVDRFYRWMRT